MRMKIGIPWFELEFLKRIKNKDLQNPVYIFDDVPMYFEDIMEFPDEGKIVVLLGIRIYDILRFLSSLEVISLDIGDMRMFDEYLSAIYGSHDPIIYFKYEKRKDGLINSEISYLPIDVEDFMPEDYAMKEQIIVYEIVGRINGLVYEIGNKMEKYLLEVGFNSLIS